MPHRNFPHYGVGILQQLRPDCTLYIQYRATLYCKYLLYIYLLCGITDLTQEQRQLLPTVVDDKGKRSVRPEQIWWWRPRGRQFHHVEDRSGGGSGSLFRDLDDSLLKRQTDIERRSGGSSGNATQVSSHGVKDIPDAKARQDGR